MAGGYRRACSAHEGSELADPVERDDEAAAGDVLVQRQHGADEQVAWAEAGVLGRERTRFPPVEAVAVPCLDRRAEQECEVPVLRRGQLRRAPLEQPGPAADLAIRPD